MIASLKRSSLTLSKHLGLSGLLAQSEWRRRRLLVLCFHGVSLEDEHTWNGLLYVSPQHFERRLALIRRSGCVVLPLGEALERMYRDDLPNRAVALTFDDGYFDFAARAWPLLQKYGYPATVYLTTARVEHNYPIVNLFTSLLLWRSRTKTLDGRGIPGLDDTHVLATPEQRQRVVQAMDTALRQRGHTAADKDAVARMIAERLGYDYDALLQRRLLTLMRPAEVTELARQGVDFQLHTHLHRTPEDASRFVADVRVNGERIEALTGSRPRHLCYPSGMYRFAYLPELRREGIQSATTCDPGLAARSSDPLLIPRFVDSTPITDIEFEGWLTGVASCLPRRTKRAHPSVH